MVRKTKKNKINTYLNSKIMSYELSEDDNFCDITVRLCYLDDYNLNGIRLLSGDDVDKCVQSLVNTPVVAYYNEDADDFDGHEVTITKDGIKFGTQAIGTHIEAWVQDDSVVPVFSDEEVTLPCVYGKARIWKSRFPVFYETLKKRMDDSIESDGKNKLGTSWELQTLDLVSDDDVDNNNIPNPRSCNNWIFLGNCILGSVQNGIVPAYDGTSEVLEISSTDFDMELSKALTKDMKLLKAEIDKDQIGKGNKLSIDLTKDSASNKKWGNIDKSSLMQQLIYCSNYKTATKKGYLVREDGWEDAPSEHLKYPVVEIVDDTEVLNINGCQSARAYLMANDKDNTSAINMLKKYYTILDLPWNDEEQSSSKNNLNLQSSSNIEDNNIKNNQGGNKKMAKKKFVTSSLTVYDLYQKVSDALNPKGWNSNPYYTIWSIYPDEKKVVCQDIDGAEDDLMVFIYTVDENDNLTLDEGTPKKLSTLLSEMAHVNINMNLDDTAQLLSQKEIKIKELETEVSTTKEDLNKANTELSAKVEAITKLGEEATKKDALIAELKPIKDEHDKMIAEQEAKAKEKKQNELKTLATKGGYITKEELELEKIKKMISELDEKGIKAEIAERVIAKLDKEQPKIETSTVINKSTKTDLNSSEEGVFTATEIIKSILNKNK